MIRTFDKKEIAALCRGYLEAFALVPNPPAKRSPVLRRYLLTNVTRTVAGCQNAVVQDTANVIRRRCTSQSLEGGDHGGCDRQLGLPFPDASSAKKSQTTEVTLG